MNVSVWSRLSVVQNVDHAARDLAWAALALTEGSETRDAIGPRADAAARDVLNEVEERIRFIRDQMA